MMDATSDALLIETRGTTQECDAYVSACAFDRGGTRAAFALGDGTVRMAPLAGGDWQRVEAHDGAALCLAPAASATGFVSGGDDARFCQVGSDGEVRELAACRGKWVEQAASFFDGRTGVTACAAGRQVLLFRPDGTTLKTLEHPSTVTGIAFDGRGKRIVASHYNGTSLWFVGSTSATPRLLEWKGSHVAVAIHPGAEAVVSAMQENALHGWRLPDGHDMRMSGYPAKPESLGFSRNGKWLASAGADAIVLWPFFGGGPMGKPPLELAQVEGLLVTRVACHPADDVVAAGYADGSIVIADINGRRVLPIAPAGHGPVTALAWSATGGHLAFGTEAGWAGIVDFTPRP